MELLLDITVPFVSFLVGAATAWALLRHPPALIADEVEDVLSIVGKHEHSYHIGGKKAGKIQYECSGCGRIRYE